MPKIDHCEHEILSAHEAGQLKSVATKAELAKFKAAARATAIKDRRVNVCLSEQAGNVLRRPRNRTTQTS